jgi:hypothetical protein
MVLSMDERKAKLAALCRQWGKSTEEMLRQATYDSATPAICTACDYTAEMEPDQDAGYCEACGTNTVVSCLVLAGLI